MRFHSYWPTATAAQATATVAGVATIAPVAAAVAAVGLVVKFDHHGAELASEAHAEERRFGRWGLWGRVTN